METICPASAQEFAEAWGEAYAQAKRLRIEGNNTKRRFAGPVADADAVFETKALSAVEEYEPRDLTIRVGAGMPYARLLEVLKAEGQMVPLDPPFQDEATVGGVVATNLCGSRRRGYGTARDYVIGVEFVDHRGRRVQSGAMVTKNVAGYDLNKLFVGSWGTLGPMLHINLRVSPLEPLTTTFLVQGRTDAEYRAVRDRVLRGFAQPIAMDYVNATAGEFLRLKGSALLIRYANAPAVVERLRQSLQLPEPVDSELEPFLWLRLREWLHQQISGHADSTVIQLSTIHSALFADVSTLGGRVVARAASGVVYAAYADLGMALDTLQFLETQGRKAILLTAPQRVRESRKLSSWKPADLGVMQQVKSHFDPEGRVNRGRMHGWF